jgi:hypothetical protein
MGIAEMSNYYYSAFLLLPLLVRFGPSFEFITLGTSALSALLVTWGRVSSTLDSRCYFQSWLFLFASLTVGVLFGASVRSRRASAAQPHAAPALAPGSG